jgi:hypothetical protein
MTVRDETIVHREGRVAVFDDSWEHYVDAVPEKDSVALAEDGRGVRGANLRTPEVWSDVATTPGLEAKDVDNGVTVDGEVWRVLLLVDIWNPFLDRWQRRNIDHRYHFGRMTDQSEQKTRTVVGQRKNAFFKGDRPRSTVGDGPRSANFEIPLSRCDALPALCNPPEKDASKKE